MRQFQLEEESGRETQTSNQDLLTHNGISTTLQPNCNREPKNKQKTSHAYLSKNFHAKIPDPAELTLVNSI